MVKPYTVVYQCPQCGKTEGSEGDSEQESMSLHEGEAMSIEMICMDCDLVMEMIAYEER